MASNKQPKAAGPATQGLRIVSRRDGGFRRAGRHFNAEGTTVPLSELTADDVEQLRSEPQLVVVDVEIDAAA